MNVDGLKIERGIPIPPLGRKTSPVIAKMLELQPGDSYLFEISMDDQIGRVRLRANLKTCKDSIRKTHPDREHTYRSVSTGIRFWRVK